MVDKRLDVGHGNYISCCLEHGLFVYGEYNPVAGSRKGIDFTFHVMRYHPRFTAIEEDGHAGGVE